MRKIEICELLQAKSVDLVAKRLCVCAQYVTARAQHIDRTQDGCVLTSGNTRVSDVLKI